MEATFINFSPKVSQSVELKITSHYRKILISPKASINSSYRPPKTSFVFNNKGRAVADPASDLRADAIAAA
jgi:hypothetical protein